MYNKSYLFNKKNNYYEELSTEYFIKTSIKNYGRYATKSQSKQIFYKSYLIILVDKLVLGFQSYLSIKISFRTQNRNKF